MKKITTILLTTFLLLITIKSALAGYEFLHSTDVPNQFTSQISSVTISFTPNRTVKLNKFYTKWSTGDTNISFVIRDDQSVIVGASRQYNGISDLDDTTNITFSFILLHRDKTYTFSQINETAGTKWRYHHRNDAAIDTWNTVATGQGRTNGEFWGIEVPVQPYILTPNGAETITREDGVNITWTESTYQNDSGKVLYDLEYSNDNGGSWTNITQLDNATLYFWNTSGLNLGAQYLVRIISKEPSNFSDINEYDESNATFTITKNPDTPTVITPNGSEKFNGKTSLINITWQNDTTAFTLNYTLEYSNDSGTNYYSIITALETNFSNTTDGTGNKLYQWNATNLNNDTLLTYRIRVSVNDNISATVNDTSDADFQIWLSPFFGNITVPSSNTVNNQINIIADCVTFSSIVSASINVTDPNSAKSTLTFTNISATELVVNYTPQDAGTYTFDGAICTGNSGEIISNDQSTMVVASSGGGSQAPPPPPEPEPEPEPEIEEEEVMMFPLFFANLTNGGGGGGRLGFITPIESKDFDIVGVNFFNKATKQLGIKPADKRQFCLEILNKADVTQTISLTCELPEKPVRADLCQWFTFDQTIITVQPTDEIRQKFCMDITTPPDLLLNEAFVVFITGKSTLGSSAKHPVTMIVSDPSQLAVLLFTRYFDDTLMQSTYELIRDTITPDIRPLPFKVPNLLFPLIILNHILFFILLNLLIKEPSFLIHLITQVLFFLIISTASIFFPLLMVGMTVMLGVFAGITFIIKRS